jgi:hypothetical protein
MAPTLPLISRDYGRPRWQHNEEATLLFRVFGRGVSRAYWAVELPSVVEASAEGTVEGGSAASTMTVRVLVEVSAFWSAAT